MAKRYYGAYVHHMVRSYVDYAQGIYCSGENHKVLTMNCKAVAEVLNTMTKQDRLLYLDLVNRGSSSQRISDPQRAWSIVDKTDRQIARTRQLI